jgi:flagellar biosynthetic protein FliP
MRPTWERVNAEAIQPYLSGTLEQPAAWDRAQQPLREFMIKQIDKSDNWEDVYMFAEAAGQKGKAAPKKIGDVSTLTLIPAFVISELKTAFQIGFLIFLPFLIIDLVVASTLMSMGMMMLPPIFISLPFKILLFVLVDGWNLVTRSLVESFS